MYIKDEGTNINLQELYNIIKFKEYILFKLVKSNLIVGS